MIQAGTEGTLWSDRKGQRGRYDPGRDRSDVVVR